jgi:sigma-54 dependent transcriptional regulator, acetoin dehydrogenase operon transcriptional activator AcoR
MQTQCKTNKNLIQQAIIRKSHERCEAYGVNKSQLFPRKILSENEVSKNLQRNEYLLRIALPYLNIIYETLAESGFFILLTDEEGCIISSVGDPDIIAESEKLNMVVGAYMNEENIGTNAMGTAISENQPIQVTASEHFISAYHRWTCSAAPIHNEKGEIIGSLNLTGKSTMVHPHTLGLAVSAVRAIENQIKADNIQQQLSEAAAYMESIIESVTAGIITIDHNGVIKTLNNSACSMLNVSKDKSIETPIEPLLPDWKKIITKLKSGETHLDMETNFDVFNRHENYDLSAYPIFDEEKKVIGAVIVLKGIQKIYNLVNKYTGMRAYYTFDNIIGNSPVFKEVIEHAAKISGSSSTVLLMGESGTGKELIAQSIHNASPLKNKVFIAVNCGALPKDLIESELFGYEEGAFTGSKKGGHAGKFELANGGTIFLDEIGEMPLDMQVNLTRVLQEGYITRIGGTKNILVNVRVIAATKKNLFDEIQKGTFRDDLFYRLSVIPLFIPPLNKRGNDKMLLFNHFINLKAQKLNKPIPLIADEVLQQVMEYHWPGNVRELENYVENLVNFNGSSNFALTNPQNQFNNHQHTQVFNPDTKTQQMLENRPASLEEVERKTIEATITRYNGNISKVSRNLGISRTTLYSKLKKYDLAVT